MKPFRLGRWIACLSVAWLLLPAGPARAERPDVFWMRGGHAHSATAVQYSPDGTIVASGGDDGTIKLWRVADGMLLRTLTGHQAPPQSQLVATIQSLSFSPDGSLLASAGNDDTVLVWSLAGGSVVRTLSGAFPGQVGCRSFCGLAFSPNGQMLGLAITSGWPAGLRIWRVADWAVLFESPVYGPFSFSPDPSTPDRVATMSSGGLHIIRIPDGAVLLDISAGGPLNPAFSPDARLLATTGGRVFVWKVALSPDGARVAAASETIGGQTDPLGPNALKLWDTQTGALALSIPDLGQAAVSLIESAKLCGVEPKAYLLCATRAALENPGTVTVPHALLAA